MLVVLELGKWKEDDQEFEVSLGSMRPCSNNKRNAKELPLLLKRRTGL